MVRFSGSFEGKAFGRGRMGSKKTTRNSAQISNSGNEIRPVNPQTNLLESTKSPRNQVARLKRLTGGGLFEGLALVAASVMALVFLTTRLTGVSVSVLIDEYVYVLDAHYKAFTESGYPNHLFQLVYSSTKACGPDFYSCARSINALFVVASAVVVYLLAMYLSKNKFLGALAWATTIFGTFGTYTAYFMPEAIFNFFMVLFIFCLVRFGASDRVVTWLGLGLILGVAALAKPHALFVVPALIIYIVLSVWSTKQDWGRSSTFRVGLFLSSTIFSKLGLGYLIAGPNGFSLLGSYGYAVYSGGAVVDTLGTNIWLNVSETALGQTLMIVMILGLALPVSLVGLIRIFKGDERNFNANKFRGLFGIALLNMTAVSALFEAWQNLNIWMHTRYYSYLIPLALVVLIEAYSNQGQERTDLTKRVVVSVFVLLSTYALLTQAIPYGANWIDAPDFAAHINNLEISSILLLAAIGLSIFWLWNSKTVIAVALGVSVFASTFAGIYITNFLNDTFGKGDRYQQIGRVLSNYLPQTELDETVLIGDELVLMQRTLFYSLSGGATAIAGTHLDFDRSILDRDVAWVLAFGSPLGVLGEAHLTGPGYHLYSLRDAQGNLPRNNQLTSFSNACSDEANSEWVCGPETTLTIDGLFPANANVDLIFDVGEFVAGSEVEFSLGGSSGVVTAPSGRFALSLSFQNAAEAQTLSIKLTGATIGPVLSDQKLIRPLSVNVG